MQYAINYFGTRFTQFPGGFRLKILVTFLYESLGGSVAE